MSADGLFSVSEIEELGFTVEQWNQINSHLALVEEDWIVDPILDLAVEETASEAVVESSFFGPVGWAIAAGLGLGLVAYEGYKWLTQNQNPQARRREVPVNPPPRTGEPKVPKTRGELPYQEMGWGGIHPEEQLSVQSPLRWGPRRKARRRR